VAFNIPMFAIFKNQRGALFGLDARVALLIFISLSIVAGYAGFSRISTAKETALAKEMKAIDQAFTQLQVDMGTFLMFALNNPIDAKNFAVLWDKFYLKPAFRKHWNGPYYTDQHLWHKEYGGYSIHFAQGDHSSGCISTSQCYVWIELTEVPYDVWNSLNGLVDESLGDIPEPTGERHIRGVIQADGATDIVNLFYRSAKRVVN